MSESPEIMRRPNIVVITSHDSGTHFGCYGVDSVQTPAIDQLAAEGVLMEQMFCTSPVCSPSRASCMTGQYPQTNGMMGLLHAPWDWRMRNPSRHMASHLREAGYDTTLFGFQHEHTDPVELGFDAQVANEPLPPATEVADAFAEYLARRTSDPAVNTSEESPFYAQIGFWETHRPWDRYVDNPDSSNGVWVPPYLVDNDEWRADLSGLQGVIRDLDNAVAIISDALQANGIDENTILVYNTDHGIEFPRAKWFCYDPGIRVAWIAKWPGGGVSGGKRISAPASNVDVLPTLFELAGIGIPGDSQGLSFAACLRDSSVDVPRDEVYGMFLAKDNRFVRTARYKLIRNFGALRYPDPPIASADERSLIDVVPVELYDLENDPNEFVNLAEDAAFSTICKDLDRRLWQWLEDVDDPILRGPTPTPAWERAIADYRRG